MLLYQTLHCGANIKSAFLTVASKHLTIHTLRVEKKPLLSLHPSKAPQEVRKAAVTSCNKWRQAWNDHREPYETYSWRKWDRQQISNRTLTIIVILCIQRMKVVHKCTVVPSLVPKPFEGEEKGPGVASYPGRRAKKCTVACGTPGFLGVVGACACNRYQHR